MHKLKRTRNIFRFTILVTLVLTIFVGWLRIYSCYKNFYKESTQLRVEYISFQKDLIKNEVDKIVDKIKYRKSKTEERVRKNVKSRTYEAYNIAMNIYRENKNNKSKREIQNIIVETLSKMNYNEGKGYYFGGDIEGGVLLLTNNPKFKKKNVLRYRDSEGRYIFRDMINIANLKGEGFYEYMWERSGDIGNDHRKISYVKLLEPLNLWIGTGEYYVDFQSELQQELLEEISKISFGENGYIFVGNFNGISLTTRDGEQRYLFGKNWSDLEDSNAIEIIQEFKKTAEKENGDFVNYTRYQSKKAAKKENEDFVNYTWYQPRSINVSPEWSPWMSGTGYEGYGVSLNSKWHEPGKGKPFERIAFVKGFPDWKWMLGAEVHLDGVQDMIAAHKIVLKNRVAENIIKLIFATFFLSALAILFELYISKKIKNIVKFQETQHIL